MSPAPKRQVYVLRRRFVVRSNSLVVNEGLVGKAIREAVRLVRFSASRRLGSSRSLRADHPLRCRCLVRSIATVQRRCCLRRELALHQHCRIAKRSELPFEPAWFSVRNRPPQVFAMQGQGAYQRSDLVERFGPSAWRLVAIVCRLLRKALGTHRSQ